MQSTFRCAISERRMASRGVRVCAFGTLALLASVQANPVLAATDEQDAIDAVENGLRPTADILGQAPVRWTLAERMAYWKVPGVSIAVIRSGRIAWSRGYGVRRAAASDAVDTETMFSVGSLSKVAAASVTLRLADLGHVDIDRDIAAYLKRWTVARGGYSGSVTLRGLMSHTAGFSIDGFADYLPGEPMPDILQTLNGSAPAKEEAVLLVRAPGSEAAYSGGGVTVEQLVDEDVTGQPIETLASELLFAPLAMERSSFTNPLPAATANVACAHDRKGQVRALPICREAMPQNGASGLWTTPSDYARLIVALYDSYHGKPGALLAPQTARDMLTQVAGSHAGLGPFLTGSGLQRRFYHSGANDSYRAWMEMNLATGNGVVIFTNSANGTRLYPEIRRAVAEAEGWSTSDALTVPDVALAPFDLASRAGEYSVRDDKTWHAQRLKTDFRPARFEIIADEAGLQLRSTVDSSSYRLIPADRDHFYLERTSERSVEFVHGYDGAIVGLIYREQDNAIEADKHS